MGSSRCALFFKGLSGSGGFDFWAQANSKDGKDPKNLPEYWKEVLQQVIDCLTGKLLRQKITLFCHAFQNCISDSFVQVSSGAGLEKSTAVAAAYPSPSNLVRAFQAGGPDLLKDMEVRRTDNVLGGSRKVGPDISRKLHTLLTCKDPDTVL